MYSNQSKRHGQHFHGLPSNHGRCNLPRRPQRLNPWCWRPCQPSVSQSCGKQLWTTSANKSIKTWQDYELWITLECLVTSLVMFWFGMCKSLCSCPWQACQLENIGHHGAVLEQSWRPLFLGRQRTSIIGDEPRLQKLNIKRILQGALRSFSR